MTRNRGVDLRFCSLDFREQIYDIYVDHSRNRFGKEDCEPGEFLSSFYSESCPTFQSEYYIGETLVGVGFVDKAYNALSSIYFIFDTNYSRNGLGTYSVIKEIEYAASLDLDYYYLGYYIRSCDSMAYKSRFLPYEVYDWDTGEWYSEETEDR